MKKSTYYEDYRCGYISLKDIPYSQWSNDIVGLAMRKEPHVYYEMMLNFSIDGVIPITPEECFNNIPKQYRSIRIYQRLLNFDFVKYYKLVPRGYLTNIKISDENKTKLLENFKYLDESIRTPELYHELSKYSFDDYLTYVVNYRNIPDEYRNKKICLAMFYSDLEYYLKQILAAYKTVELYEMLTERDFDKYFGAVPCEYRTPRMYEKLVAKNPMKYLDQVPMEKRTQLMYDMYFECTLDSNFENIPQQFRTQAMYNRLVRVNLSNSYNAIETFSKVPIQYIDSDIALEILKLGTENVKYIPEKLRTAELYLKLIELDPVKYLRVFPLYFCNEETIDKLAEIILDKVKIHQLNDDIPFVDIIIIHHPELLSRFNLNIIKRILEKDLCDIISNDKTVSELQKQYALSGNTLSTVLQMINKEDDRKYNEIKKRIKEENYEQNELYRNNIKRLKEIIISLGNVTRRTLKTEHKLQIAYQINKYIDIPLEEIYHFIINVYHDNYAYKEVSNFIGNTLEYSGNYNRIRREARTNRIAFSNPWLANFDFDKYFDIKDGVAHSTYKFGPEEKTLTLEIANQVINRLKMEEIPLNHLIVVLAFRNYFNNSLDEYINELHSYDLIFDDIKRKKR